MSHSRKRKGRITRREKKINNKKATAGMYNKETMPVKMPILNIEEVACSIIIQRNHFITNPYHY